jgi:uncharacterized protein YjiS (DUF1127 family)
VPVSQERRGSPWNLISKHKDRAMNHLQDVSAPAPQSKPCKPWLQRAWTTLSRCLERARTRRLLGQLNAQQLSDLGISHADRLMELDKPFWR